MNAPDRSHEKWCDLILNYPMVACGEDFRPADLKDLGKAPAVRHQLERLADNGVLSKNKEWIHGCVVVRYRLGRSKAYGIVNQAWRTFPNSQLPKYPLQFGVAV